MLRWRVQKPDRIPPYVRRQVGVAKRHVHRGMPHKLLDGLERHAAAETVDVRDMGDTEAARSADALENDVSHG
jgi:hypothetical protein